MNGKTQVIMLALVWAVATAAGIAAVLSVGILPSPAATEAHIVDRAMTLLTVLAVPVFVLVVMLLVYSMIRFRHRGVPTEDGPPIRGNLRLEVVWVLVTLGLTLFLAGYGTVGLLEIRAVAAEAPNPLVVQVKSKQWLWEFHYPEQNISTAAELVLPVGRTARFEITATDVLHSFWIPAFRMKIDAVPGMVTTVSVTPNRTGSFQEDYHFRVQCAELCGVAHGAMIAAVTVLEQADFDAWVAKKTAKN